MTVSGRPEIGRQDVLWTLSAHRIDILRMSVDPKMVQILTKIFKSLLKGAASRRQMLRYIRTDEIAPETGHKDHCGPYAPRMWSLCPASMVLMPRN